MYRIINSDDGTAIGSTEAPRFIYRKFTGCFVETDEKNAQGIAFKNVPYNLLGREGIGVDETVILSEYDSGSDNYL